MRTTVKRGTTILLLTASLIIWGIVGLRIYQGLEVHTEEEVALQDNLRRNNINEPVLLSEEAFLRRISEVKSPFYPSKKKAVRIKKPRPKPLPPVRMPHVQYIGFMEGDNGLLAIVEGENERTGFCAVGDTIFNIKVIAIHPEKLGIKKGKKTDWITLRK
ncbi:MAG: hypothetical protein ACRBF0_08800 [Calditrichia bacterium]